MVKISTLSTGTPASTSKLLGNIGGVTKTWNIEDMPGIQASTIDPSTGHITTAGTSGQVLQTSGGAAVWVNSTSLNVFTTDSTITLRNVRIISTDMSAMTELSDSDAIFTRFGQAATHGFMSYNALIDYINADIDIDTTGTGFGYVFIGEDNFSVTVNDGTGTSVSTVALALAKLALSVDSIAVTINANESTNGPILVLGGGSTAAPTTAEGSVWHNKASSNISFRAGDAWRIMSSW